MFNFSNSTKFGVKNDAERYLWAGWLTFVFVSSLLGDSLILVASIKHRAFNLHKMIVTFIQHIAVNDLLSTVGSIAPLILSTIYETGSPHKFIDYARLFILYYTTVSNSVFISALTLVKLLLLKYPLKLRNLPKKHAHKICAGIWVFCLYVPVLHLGIDKDDIIFDYRLYGITYRYTSPIWKIVMPLSTIVILIVPGVTVVVSTVLILREARKVVRRTQESLRWQGITTVVLTATVYSIAFLPTTIFFFAEPFVEKDPNDPGMFCLEFYRVAVGILQFNIISNFFIYSLTVVGFRKFLVTNFYKVVSLCWKCSSYHGNVLFTYNSLYIIVSTLEYNCSYDIIFFNFISGGNDFIL